MTSAFHRLFKRLMGATMALCLGLCLILIPFGTSAQAGTAMSGDFAADTVSVARSLRETIAIPQDAEGQSEAKDEALLLINDYISRYRNRSQVNKTVSFTTMQTALNSMAGHYKTFANRPLSEALKDRLNNELTKAEAMVGSEK